MTIFHVIKYSNNVWYDVINDLPLKVRYQFWNEFHEQSDREQDNIVQFLKDFLLNYEGPHESFSSN